MRIKLVSVLVVAFVVIAAGCGGGGNKKSATPAAATTTAPAAATTTSATSTGATTAPAAPFASTKNCAELIGLGAKFAQAFTNAKANITDQAKAFQALAAAAPSEIRGDFVKLATAFGAYAQAIQKAGLKAGQTPTAAQLAQLQAAAKAFSTPDLKVAEQHLSAWGQKNCGTK
jgi:hypothetical protein